MAWLVPADLVLQQAAWWSAVLLAVHGRPLAGGAACLAPVLLHLAFRPGERPRLLCAALVAAAYGLATDTALAAAGLESYAGAREVSPAWMVGLWAIFGVQLTASLRTVAGWPLPALALLGALAGPLAYRGGVALGAITLAGPLAFASVAAQWAVGLPLLAWVSRSRSLAQYLERFRRGQMNVVVPGSAGRARRALLAPLALLAGGCATARPPMPTVARVDLTSFSGDWFVIAHIPASLEKNAFNAVESYRVARDGTIETTYTFRDGGFEGERKRYTPRGFVRDHSTNATWGMQFVWPLRMEYLVILLDEERGVTVIGRTDRDYVWIMARTPEIPEEELARLVAFVGERGYDVTRLRRVPQRWPERG